MTITAIVSMYLLSWLGIERENYENTLIEHLVDTRPGVFFVGGMGLLSMLIVALISMSMLVRTRNDHQRRPPTQRSARGFSAGDVEENAIALALV